MRRGDETYRILTPSEYSSLLKNIPKLEKRILVETMLNTGMRYTELQRLGDNSQWYNSKLRVIVLPAKATKTLRGRTVHLTPQFSDRLELYLDKSVLRFPPRQSMDDNLERWSKVLSWSPNCKTFRKTWETWLIFAGYDSLHVAANMGHSQTMQLRHYLNLAGYLKNEKALVEDMTRGWMT